MKRNNAKISEKRLRAAKRRVILPYMQNKLGRPVRDPYAKIGLTISRSALAQVQTLAQRRGVSASRIIEQATNQYLKRLAK